MQTPLVHGYRMVPSKRCVKMSAVDLSPCINHIYVQNAICELRDHCARPGQV